MKRSLKFAGSGAGVGPLTDEEIAGLGGEFDAEAAGTEAGGDVALEDFELAVEDGGDAGLGERLVDDGIVDAVDEFGGEAAADGVEAGAFEAAAELFLIFIEGAGEAEAAGAGLADVAGSGIAGHKDEAALEVDRGAVAEAHGGLVENTEQDAAERCSGLLDFVKQDDAEAAAFAGGRGEFLLGDHGLGFTVAEVAGGRADEFGDLVLHLELAAVDAEEVGGAAVENFGEGLDSVGLAGAGGTKQEKDAAGASGRREAGLKDLDARSDGVNGLVLADDAAAKLGGNVEPLV